MTAFEESETIASEDERLQASLRELRASAQASTDLPEEYWSAQRQAVRMRAAAQSRRRAPGWAWGMAAAAALLALALQRHGGQNTLPVESIDPDHQLLLDVSSLLHRQVPVALEPAALLVQEMTAASEKQ